MLVGTSTMKINLLNGGHRLSAQQRAKTKDNLGHLPRSQSALDRKSVVPKFLHKPSQAGSDSSLLVSENTLSEHIP